MTDYLKLVARKDGFLGRLDDFLKYVLYAILLMMTKYF